MGSFVACGAHSHLRLKLVNKPPGKFLYCCNGIMLNQKYKRLEGRIQSMPPTPRHPLGEVFGFPTDNFSSEADRYRGHKLCPFGNKVPNCTKDKAENPLGVCSVKDG